MFKEHQVFKLIPIASAPISSPIVDQHLVVTPNNEPTEEEDPEAPDVVMDIPLRRLKTACRPVISDDYIVYLQNHEYDVGDVSNTTNHKEAIASPQLNF